MIACLAHRVLTVDCNTERAGLVVETEAQSSESLLYDPEPSPSSPSRTYALTIDCYHTTGAVNIAH